jgi:hypothetical protein
VLRARTTAAWRAAGRWIVQTTQLLAVLVIGVVAVCYARLFDRINAENYKGTLLEFRPGGLSMWVTRVVGLAFIVFSVGGMVVLYAGSQ